MGEPPWDVLPNGLQRHDEHNARVEIQENYTERSVYQGLENVEAGSVVWRARVAFVVDRCNTYVRCEQPW